jgi:cytochrome c-type biogenesis protein CcmH/NrfF
MAYAADSREQLDKKAYDLYQKVFSPFCPGRSLNDCPSSKAQELKAEMRAKLESGVPPDTILEDVFQTFGEKYRTVPHYSGVGKLVWWVPLGFLAVGFALVMFAASKRKRAATSGETTKPDPLSPETKEAIERELASLDT